MQQKKAIFSTEEKARQHSTNTIKSKVILLPIYMRRRTWNIRITNIPPEDVAWLVVATIVYNPSDGNRTKQLAGAEFEYVNQYVNMLSP